MARASGGRARAIVLGLAFVVAVAAAMAIFVPHAALAGPGPTASPTQTPKAPATNDAFANATDIVSLPFEDHIDPSGGTFAANDPYPSCANFDEVDVSLWYRYTPSANTTVTFAARARYPFTSFYWRYIAVFTGTKGSLLEAGCGYGQLTVGLSTGNTYYVLIAHHSAPGDRLDFIATHRDADLDGVPDGIDNCTFTINPDQTNSDNDGRGDACDSDDDNDGYDDYFEYWQGSDPLDRLSVPETYANCADGIDNDGDGLIDVADPGCDYDGDGLPDIADNCPYDANADQLNFDGDFQGDACDYDDDNDSAGDYEEIAYGSDPFDPLSVPEVSYSGKCADGLDNDGDGLIDGADPSCDQDSDGVPDLSDNCEYTANADQFNFDGDSQGDACDYDDDNDMWDDTTEIDQGTNPFDPASSPELEVLYFYPVVPCLDGIDNDGDGLTDGADPGCDADGDGVPFGLDNCYGYANPSQLDFDGDGYGDACDYDDDGDGWDDIYEDYYGTDPFDPLSVPELATAFSTPNVCVDGLDNDGDGLIDGADPGCDYDGDGVAPPGDNCPYTYNTGQENYDGDAEGDACDYDGDNDGFDSYFEEYYGSDPLNAASTPEHAYYASARCTDGIDNDADGLTDEADPGCDYDRDGVPASVDNCPYSFNPAQLDADGDGVGDACDFDDDNDGFPDYAEDESDPINANSVPESNASNPGSCADGIDNDLDGYTDAADTSCDYDRDATPDKTDNCMFTFNPKQEDLDGDGLGNACDEDDDGDGFDDYQEYQYGSNMLDANSVPEQPSINPGSCTDGIDNDLDGLIDKADPGCDYDGDGVADSNDNCPFAQNPGQDDLDGDGEGDVCDYDDDGDGFDDYYEYQYDSDPRDANSTPELYWLDTACSDGLDNDLDGLTDGDDPGCVNPPTPGPTLTPTPRPTLAPCPTEASIDCPEMGLTASGAGVSCNANATPAKCSVPLGAGFTIGVDAVDAPDAGYIGLQIEVEYGTELVYDRTVDPATEMLWPDRVFTLRTPSLSSPVSHAASTSFIPPYPASHYQGPILQLAFRCSTAASSTAVRLAPYHPDNTNGAGFKSAGSGNPSLSVPPTSLIINCTAGTTPTPVQPTPASVGGLGTYPHVGGGTSAAWWWWWRWAAIATGGAMAVSAAVVARRGARTRL